MIRDVDKTREKVGIDKLSMKERDGLVQDSFGPTINGHLDGASLLRGGTSFGPIGGPA